MSMAEEQQNQVEQQAEPALSHEVVADAAAPVVTNDPGHPSGSDESNAVEANESTEQPVSFDQLELQPEETSGQAEEFSAELKATAEKVTALEAERQELNVKLEDYKAQYLRISADFENFRKRTAREKEDLEVSIRCSTLEKLLPVIDNFERARTQLKPEGEEALKIHGSYQSIYKQFVDSFKRLGVKPMQAEGQLFDPALHEAMLRESTDQHPEGTVIEELQRGYVLGERVLRHAMVKVAAPLEPVITSEESDEAAEGTAS